ILDSGAEVRIPKEDILKVNPLGSPDKPELSPHERMKRRFAEMKARPYSFREKGLYGTAGMFLTPLENNGGLGFDAAIGYRFNRFLGLGAGMGIYLINIDDEQRFIPAFLELRGFVLAKKITPYYNVRGGYIFPLQDSFFGFYDEAEGGLSFAPEIGIRFGGDKRSFFAGAEYFLAKARYVYYFSQGPEQSVIEDIQFRRVSIRLGVLF